ncbi:MAG: hypothetical protein AB7N76_01840 [Planctomycetota bacterium]
MTGPRHGVGRLAAALLALGVLALSVLSWAQEKPKDAKEAPKEEQKQPPAPDEPPSWARRDKCTECHSETSWTKISEPDGPFDHTLTGFPLEGAHADPKRARCADCHRRGLRQLSQRCASCHQDPHAGANSQACERCHNARTWDVPRNFFIHERTRFPLSGAHAAIACEACHRNARGEPLAVTPTECEVCHIRDRIRALPNHVAAGFTNCGWCHTTSTFRRGTYTHRTYVLNGVHALQSCTNCHAGQTFAGLAAGGTDCLVCHQAQFNSTAGNPNVPNHTTGPPFGSDCGRCHTAVNPPLSFTGATIR